MKTTKPSPRAKKLEKAKEANPYFDQTLLEEMVADADTYHSLKTLHDSEAGRVLVDVLVQDVARSISRLENHEDMSRDQLVSVISRMTTSLNTARALSRAADNLEYADEALEEALRE